MRTPTRAQSAGRWGGRAGRGQRGRSRAGRARGARGGEARAWLAQAGQAVAEAAVAAGMGDGGAERHRGPARRESQSGRGGEGGVEQKTTLMRPAAAPGRLPAPPTPALGGPGRAAPTATGSRGSAKQTTAAASRCEVRTARSPGPLDSSLPSPGPDLPAASTSQVLYPFRRSSSSHSFSKHYLEGLLCWTLS